MRLINCVFVLSIVVAMRQDIAQAQDSSALQQRTPPALMTIDQGTEQKHSASIQHPALSQNASSSSCTLRVPETVTANAGTSQPPAIGNQVLPYRPLSARCKFHLFVRQTYSPYTFASAGFQATWDQAMGQWPQFGGGMQGWGKRFGTSLADTESRRLIQSSVLSTVLHQDPRYFPSHRQSLIARARYAATRVVIVRNDNGSNGFNTSEFLGALFASSLQNTYYPRHYRTFGNTMSRYGGALSSDALDYLLREFTPDMKRLFRKHAPKDIQKIEEKLPIPADEKP